MPEHQSAETLTARALDYMGMGFLLAPPEVLLLEAIVTPGPINWTLVISTWGGCYVVGIVLLAIGLRWQKVRPLLSEVTATRLTKFAGSPLVWIVFLVFLAFGPAALVAGFSTQTNASHEKAAVTQTPIPSTEASSTKTPFLGLDDAKRWQWAWSLFHVTVGNNNRRVTSCSARVWGAPPETPGFKSSSAFWNEIMQVMYLGDWSLAGGQHTKNYFPDGIAIAVGDDHGETFDCGFHLSEWLKSIGVKNVTFEANQSTPDLVECKNECIELVIGNVTMR